MRRQPCTLLRLFSIVLALFLVEAARAQTSSGIISGIVTDSSGQSIPSADVRLTNELTADVHNTATERSGDFVFTSIVPGRYSITVIAPGFKQYQKKGLVLSASERLSAGTVVLQIGAVNESITVTAEATPVETTSGERSAALNDKQMQTLMSVGRDFTSFVRVLPGVVGGGGSSSLGTFSLPTINGVRSEYNQATLDGVVGNTRGYNNLDTPPNLDAIAEVKVLQGNYQAEYGKTAGSVITAVTKSGTQQFHGTGYWYVRNEDFNANTYFNNLNGLDRSRYRYNTIGGNIGGPIYWPGKFNVNKTKLFAFYSQEYLPNKAPEGIKYYTVPTARERQGDFTQSLGTNGQLIQLTDPLNGKALPGNTIPASRINPDMQKILNIFPQPNFTNRAISGGNYNYVTSTFADQPVNQQILRVDYNPSDKWRMYFRGLNMSVDNTGYNSPANKLQWLMPVDYRTTNPNVVFNLVYAASPTLVNELTLGTAEWTEDQSYQKSDLAKIQKNLLGISLTQFNPQLNPLDLVPAITFGTNVLPNTASVAYDSRFPMHDVVTSLSLTDGLTKILNRHTLKVGIDLQGDQYLQEHTGGTFTGTFDFTRSTTNPFESGDPYSNALFGYFNSYSEPSSRLDYKPRTKAVEWYVQDQWRVTKKLTLDYGLRFTYGLPQTLKVGANFVPGLYSAANAAVLYAPAKVGGKNVAIDPRVGSSVTYPAAYVGSFIPGTGNIANGAITTFTNTPGYPSSLVYGAGLVVAPRFGFAYDPYGDGKTAIRGGFGIFNNARPRSGQMGDLTSNPPAQETATQYYNNVSAFLDGSTVLSPSNVGHAIELNPKMLSSYNFSFGIQRNIGFGTVLDVSYVGTLGRHLSDFRNINEVPYGAHFLKSSHSPIGGVLPDNFLRPYPGYGTINMQTFDVTSSYHSLQTQVNKRFSRGLQFGAVYTWSRAMDYTDDYTGTLATYNNIRTWNYGPAGFDRRHNVAINWLWNIPGGSHLWKNAVTKTLLDNWQLSGIATFISGAPCEMGLNNGNTCGGTHPSTPFTTVDNTDITGGGDGARAVVLANATLPSDQRTFYQFFNTAAFGRPAVGTVGNAPKVLFYGPGAANWDTALFKNIPVKERATFQIRIEAYNTFNHSQFTGVNTAAKFGPAGNQTNPLFGQLGTAANPRYMQFAARFSF